MTSQHVFQLLRELHRAVPVLRVHVPRGRAPRPSLQLRLLPLNAGREQAQVRQSSVTIKIRLLECLVSMNQLRMSDI